MRRRRFIVGTGAALTAACNRRSSVERAMEVDSTTPAPAPAGSTRPTTLRLLTYNVLADEVALDRRIPALMRAMEASSPDILALQEVAPWFLGWIEGSRWLQDFHVATIEGQVARPNGQLILSRLPILESRARRLSGVQGRSVLISRIELDAGEQLSVATTHMESFLEDGPVRARQLDEIFAELTRERDDPLVTVTALCGDLNFGAGEQPDSAHLDPEFVDAWTTLRPDEPGYTWDIERSEMARAGSFVDEPSRRLDRVLLRARGWRPRSIEIIGDRPVEPDDRRLFPSDHFGLIAELARA